MLSVPGKWGLGPLRHHLRGAWGEHWSARGGGSGNGGRQGVSAGGRRLDLSSKPYVYAHVSQKMV